MSCYYFHRKFLINLASCLFVAAIIIAPAVADSGKFQELIHQARESRGATELSKLAASMKPGQWAELKARRPADLMEVFAGYRDSGREAWYHIAGWTDDGQWDTKTGQFFYMGFRRQFKFISFSDKDNAWTVIPGPFGWHTPGKGALQDDRTTTFGHAYGGNALDIVGGKFYRAMAGYTYVSDIADQSWDRFPGGNMMSIEFFPGLGLLSHSSKPHRKGFYKLELFDEKNKKWIDFTELPFSAHHALARYNYLLDEILIIAGNDSRTVVKIDPDGTVTRLKDLPFDMTIRHGKLVVEPNTGKYLIFNLGKLFEFSSTENEYREVPDFKDPWDKYEMPVPATIPEYGVIMFVDKKTLLYKHASDR